LERFERGRQKQETLKLILLETENIEPQSPQRKTTIDSRSRKMSGNSSASPKQQQKIIEAASDVTTVRPKKKSSNDDGFSACQRRVHRI
jgi:hypothetical protein